MKMVTTIALLALGAVGVGVAVLVSGGSGGKDACPVIQLTNEITAANLSKIERWAKSLRPTMKARKAARDLYAAVFPHCDWSDDVDREIIDVLGRRTTWQKILAAAGDLTVEEMIASAGELDPFGGGLEGAAPTGSPTLAKAMGFG